MSHNEAAHARIQDILKPLVTAPGGVKRLARKSGLSEPTIRTVAATGRISNAQTAARLENATGGLITVSMIETDMRGKVLYSSDFGRTVLDLAIKNGATVRSMLNKIGITMHELWLCANKPDPQYDEMKRRVRTALEAAGTNAGDGK